MRMGVVVFYRNIMVMGGGEIYSQAMPYAQRLYITEVNVDVKGDASFPALEKEQWQEMQRVAGASQTEQPDYDFVVYARRQA